MTNCTIIRVLGLLIAFSGFAGNAHASMHAHTPGAGTAPAIVDASHTHAHPEAPAPAGSNTSLNIDCCQLTLCSQASAVLDCMTQTLRATTDRLALSGATTAAGLRYPPPIRPPR